MGFLFLIIDLAFKIANFIIIAQVALHWLTIFGIVNLEHPQARQVVEWLHRVTEPVYSKIRRFIPPIGGIDLTPLIALIALGLLRGLLYSLLV